MPDIAIIFAAGGSSSRFGRNKLFEPLDGIPVILRAMRAFTAPVAAFSQRGLYIAASPETSGRLADLLRQSPIDAPVHFVPGGATRAHSVHNALTAIPQAIDYVAIHDAARPLVSPDLIARTYAQAARSGAAAPALPVHLTIKEAAGPLPAPILRTVPRHTLWAMQTPQVMRRADLLDAYARCPLPYDQITDDVQLLELTGHPVTLLPGEERNLKITTPMDQKLASLWLKEPL